MPIIPKKMWFIWVGSKKLPPEYIENICLWAKLNPSFEVTVLVDHKSAETHYFEEYPKDFCEEVKRIIIIIQSIIQSDKDPAANVEEQALALSKRIIFLDIESIDGFSDEIKDIVRYLIDQPEPNYGMASDFLRYLILFTYGGIYFDTDIKPLLVGSLEGLTTVFSEHEENRLYCRSLGNCGSDVLACAPKNAAIKKMSDSAIKLYYSDNAEESSTIQHAYRSRHRIFLPHDIVRDSFVDTTLTISGPHRLYEVRKEMPEVVFFLCDAGFRIPIISDNTWFDNCNILSDLTIAVERAISCMVFEVTNFGWLSLDYHIWAIIKSLKLGRKEISSEKVIEQLFPKLAAKLTPEFCAKIKIAQLTFQYPETLKFYEIYMLLGKTRFLLGSKDEVITPAMANSIHGAAIDTFYQIIFSCNFGDGIQSDGIQSLVNSLIFVKGVFRVYNENLLAAKGNPDRLRTLMNIVVRFWDGHIKGSLVMYGEIISKSDKPKTMVDEIQTEFDRIQKCYKEKNGEKKSIGTDSLLGRRVGGDPRMFVPVTTSPVSSMDDDCSIFMAMQK